MSKPDTQRELQELVDGRHSDQPVLQRAKLVVTMANAEREVGKLHDGIGYLHWLTRLHRNGITKGFAADLNKTMRPITFKSSPTIDLAGKMRRPYEHPIESTRVHPEWIAFDVAMSLNTGGLDKLKRCGYHKCKRFFLGRADATVCCGSHLVLKKRAEAASL